MPLQVSAMSCHEKKNVAVALMMRSEVTAGTILRTVSLALFHAVSLGVNTVKIRANHLL